MIRLPYSNNKTLQAWNAADELLVQTFEALELKDCNTLLFNDRFGYLALHLNTPSITEFIDLYSQQVAIEANLKKIKPNQAISFIKMGESLPTCDVALINIPKSLDQLELYLELVTQSISKDGIVLLGFMTKHFTPNFLKLCEKYFKDITQSKALKKARVITLKNKIEAVKVSSKEHTIDFPLIGKSLAQFKGVFSKNRIDYATQFLIENIQLNDSEQTILDLGSGNGVIACYINKIYPNRKIHLLDDSYAAHISGQLNLNEPNTTHHWHYELSTVAPTKFDLIVTNPPFHFGHEIDLTIPFGFVAEAQKHLHPNGRLLIVSNSHINYDSILQANFKEVTVIAINEKFKIWEAIKG